MRLADFISLNLEPILAEWVRFARSCGPAGKAMDRAELRDHATEMLKAMVADLRTPQTGAEQAEKSKGKAVPAPLGLETAAEVHGTGRAEKGFSIEEMVSEYRALRASVLRLWAKASPSLTQNDFEDVMRFNEAIDQALAESIARYTHAVDRSKEMFLAILGHDLRTPLVAVISASEFLLENGELSDRSLSLMTCILRSARRMSQMIGDLLDFTRSQLGSGVPIDRASTDLAMVVGHAVEEVEAAWPESDFQLVTTGDLRGEWDSARISQVLANLLGNAVQHGTPKAPIDVTARGEEHEVVLRVHNQGASISASDLQGLFNPFKRVHSAGATLAATGSLGLGLHIAERIVLAHRGSIDVQSIESAGTSFTVRLPR